MRDNSNYYQHKETSKILRIDKKLNILGKDVVETYSENNRFIEVSDFERDYVNIPAPTNIKEAIAFHKKIGYDTINNWALAEYIKNDTVGNPKDKILQEYAKKHGTIKLKPYVACYKCDNYISITPEQEKQLLETDSEIKIGCRDCYKKRKFSTKYDVQYPFIDLI